MVTKTDGEPEEATQLVLNANEIPFATTGLDCPTFYVDLIRGPAVLGEITKIALIENKVDAIAGEVKSYHVLNLVVPTPQLRSWGAYFTKLADQVGLPPADV